MSIHSYVYNINEKDSFEPAAYLLKTNIKTQPEINSADIPISMYSNMSNVVKMNGFWSI